jgi:glycosyltransferase involved in cell wall biosynthesis
MRTTVLVTLLNDPRAARCVQSIQRQSMPVDEILIADGGSSAANLKALRELATLDPRIRILNAPGTVAQTRNTALDAIASPIVAFLDADEVAPPTWLESLTAPIRAGEVDFVGGPTRPLAPARTAAERYVNAAEAELYRTHVPRDLALLPMGNSAWRTELLRRIGGFDARLAWGGEDYDVNLRALRSGARGRFVEAAFVYHDQAHLDSFGKILRRKRRYYFGAATAYLKNEAFGGRALASARRFRPRHPVDLLDLALKPWAWLRAKRYVRRSFPTADK